MIFSPLSEEEIQTASLLKDGIYTYQVLQSEEKISKTNNEYISLILQVWDDKGKVHRVFTNLALIKLLKHFCDVNDLQDDYKSGSVAAEKCLDRSGGKVIIGIDPEKPNPNGGFYKAKNIVLDYVKDAIPSSLQPIKNKDEFIDSDLPF